MAANGIDSSMPHLNIHVDENNLTSGAVKILAEIRPSWKIENIEFKVSFSKKRFIFNFSSLNSIYIS